MTTDADAEDVAQNALIRAWRMRHACRSADAKAWLRQIARNESLRAHAAQRAHATLDLVAERGEDDAAVETVPERLSVAPPFSSSSRSIGGCSRFATKLT
jgi:DNA-directed RNA polymerase specialized sigma24 family protein